MTREEALQVLHNACRLRGRIKDIGERIQTGRTFIHHSMDDMRIKKAMLEKELKDMKDQRRKAMMVLDGY